MRGATTLHMSSVCIQKISIHAPHAGCDFSPFAFCSPSFYFNPRTPCGVRRVDSSHPLYNLTISIHAPHAGCDKRPVVRLFKVSDFNPRTPCGVRRSHPSCQLSLAYFNPRTPCGVRLPGGKQPKLVGAISIHAPHAGCDQPKWSGTGGRHAFQSTHPMRGATGYANGR